MADIEQGVGGFGSHVRSGFRSIGLWVLGLFGGALYHLYWLLIVIILVVLVSLFAVLAILWPFISMVMLSFEENWEGDEEDPDVTSSSPSMVDIYKKWKPTETLFYRLRVRSLRLLARLGLLLQLWLVLNFFIPRLKVLTLLGSPLWRWSLLAVALICSRFFVGSLYPLHHMFLSMLDKADGIIRRCLSRPSALVPEQWHYLLVPSNSIPAAIFSIYSGMVLVLWLFYFRTDAGLRHASTPHPQAFEYVTWTFVSLFVGSILIFLKTLFLVKWSDNAIYSRFQSKIIIASVKLVYLCFFVGGIYKESQAFYLSLMRSTGDEFNYTNYIMSRRVSWSYLEFDGRKLSSLAKMVKPLQEDGVPKLLEFLGDHDFFRAGQVREPANEEEKQLLHKHGPLGHVLQVFQSIGGAALFSHSALKTTDMLLCLVREQAASEDSQLTPDDLKIWLLDAHKNCVNLGRTLIDANAIVKRLDIFLSFIIVLIVVLLWLLITGIATTTILVTIATPLVALTFIFGDSAKQFFQGIIFCFGTHAFDVGDRCIIDDTELEVKNMDILTTTFNKVGTAEKRFYPNSVLATKAIVNLGWQPDPSDTVELTLDYSTTFAQWQMFEKKVEQFFNHSQQKEFFLSWHELMMKESDDKIKVIIRFKHVLKVNEMTHGECLQKKNRQRSKILKKVNYFLDHTSPTTRITNEIEQVTNFRPGYLRSKSEGRYNREIQNARLSGHSTC